MSEAGMTPEGMADDVLVGRVAASSASDPVVGQVTPAGVEYESLVGRVAPQGLYRDHEADASVAPYGKHGRHAAKPVLPDDAATAGESHRPRHANHPWSRYEQAARRAFAIVPEVEPVVATAVVSSDAEQPVGVIAGGRFPMLDDPATSSPRDFAQDDEGVAVIAPVVATAVVSDVVEQPTVVVPQPVPVVPEQVPISPAQPGPPEYGAYGQPPVDPNQPLQWEAPDTAFAPARTGLFGRAPNNQPSGAPMGANTGTNGWAVAALVMGIVSFSVPAIFVGWLGLRRSREIGGRGRAMSIAGMVLGVLWLFTSLFVLNRYGPGSSTGTLAGAGITTGHAVGAGQCVNVEPQGQNNAEFTVISCSEPHDAEVISVASVRDADGNVYRTFPGTEAVTDQADNFCVTEFSNYVGSNLETSEFNMSFSVPTEETWQTGDRSIICYATTTDGTQLPPGTVRGSRR